LQAPNRIALVAPSESSLKKYVAASHPSTKLENELRRWLLPPANAATAKEPSESEIEVLREAFRLFYGEKNAIDAEPLLNRAIEAWEKQPPDERAGLHRVRGDCYMRLSDPSAAVADYSRAISLLETPEAKEKADPTEMPASRLGRARASRSLPKSEQRPQRIAEDYEMYFLLSAPGLYDDYENDDERISESGSRNPYAVWEWASSLRSAGDYKKAASIHQLASDSFDLIGDRARSVLSELDRGIDLAMVYASSATQQDFHSAKAVLSKAISTTTKVEGRDIPLLQRVIAKEAEARIALAAILWDAGDRSTAEAQFGEACIRLEQLDTDDQQRAAAAAAAAKDNKPKKEQDTKMYSIDATLGAGQITCAKFKNDKFITDILEWSDLLKNKVVKLENLR